MFCTKCGTQIPDGSKFCYKCGAPVPTEQKDSVAFDYFDIPPASYTPPAQQQHHQQQSQYEPTGQADDGMYGLVGFILSFFIPIVGLILSIMGLSRQKNRGLAKAGVVISIVSMLISIVLIIVAAVLTSSSYDYTYPYYYYNYACSYLL